MSALRHPCLNRVRRPDMSLSRYVRVRQYPKEFTLIEGTFVYGEQIFSRNLITRPNIWVNRVSFDNDDDSKWAWSRCENGPSGPDLLAMLASADSPYDELQNNFSGMNMEDID